MEDYIKMESNRIIGLIWLDLGSFGSILARFK